MCPDCKEPLVIFELDGVEIDHCLSCGGTWLDSGELELLTELCGIHTGEISRALVESKSTGRSPRRCPGCRRKLEVIHIGEGDLVELDRCPIGHGFWLDRGETVAVINAFGDTSEGTSDAEEKVVAAFFARLCENELKM